MSEEFNGRFSNPREDRAVFAMLTLPVGSIVIGGICGLLDGQGIEINQNTRNGMLYAPAFLCAAVIPPVHISSRRSELEEMAKEHPDNAENQRLLKEFNGTEYEVHQIRLAAIAGAFGAGSTLLGYACGRAASFVLNLF